MSEHVSRQQVRMMMIRRRGGILCPYGVRGGHGGDALQDSSE